MQKIFAVLCTLGAAALACGDTSSDPTSGSTSTSNGSDPSSDTPPVTPTTTFELECTPGQQRCADENTVEVCNATGFGWDQAACTQYQKCQESAGDDGMTAVCEGPCELLKDTSIGCEFVAIRMRSGNAADEPDTDDAIMVGNTDTEKTAVVSLYLVPDYFNLKEDLVEGPIELKPGESHVFMIDNGIMPGYTAVRTGGVYHVVSDYPVSAYLHSPFQGSDSNDASMLLPVKALGTDYIITSYPGWVKADAPPEDLEQFTYGRPSYFNVIVTEDDTEISWTPRAKTLGSGFGFDPKEVEAGATGTITLDRYEVLQVGAASVGLDTPFAKQDVSGTIVRANKPIAVMGATACARVPADSAGGCNHLQEQVLPYKYWGKSYLAAHAPFRGGDEDFHWRVYAGAANQKFSLDPNPGVPNFSLKEVGEFKDIVITGNVKSFAFKSGDPFMAVQLLAGHQESGDIADPAMFQSIPVQQHLNRYVFVTGKNYAQNFAQVIRKKNGPPVFINGVEIGPWELVNVSVSGGDVSSDVCDWPLDPDESRSYLAESEGPFGVNVIGYDDTTAYAYPAGMALKPLNPDDL
ncbi:MAG: IgGFc-binding protein [Myxococcales bacterium]|nr:IgGFc-binding protein [Myxococcales bacterium]